MQSKTSSKMSVLNYNFIPYLVILFGFLSIAVSIIYTSSITALIGLALIFWGLILRYITPIKHVPFRYLLVSSSVLMSNIQRTMSEHSFTGKGIYLPPKQLKEVESSLVLIPKSTENQPAPDAEKQNQLLNSSSDGLFLTPPGADLCRYFEKELGISFLTIDLSFVQNKFPKILFEDLGIAQKASVKIENADVTFDIKGTFFMEDCEQSQKFSVAHDAVGCLLSSSLACALAKVTGKGIAIMREECKGGQNMLIQYKILEQ